jgi:hypothetical protein
MVFTGMGTSNFTCMQFLHFVYRNAHWFNYIPDLFVSCTALYRFVPTVCLFVLVRMYVMHMCISGSADFVIGHEVCEVIK